MPVPPVQPPGSFLNPRPPAPAAPAQVTPPTQESMRARQSQGLDPLTPEQRQAGYTVSYSVDVGLGIGFSGVLAGSVTSMRTEPAISVTNFAGQKVLVPFSDWTPNMQQLYQQSGGKYVYGYEVTNVQPQKIFNVSILQGIGVNYAGSIKYTDPITPTYQITTNLPGRIAAEIVNLPSYAYTGLVDVILGKSFNQIKQDFGSITENYITGLFTNPVPTVAASTANLALIPIVSSGGIIGKVAFGAIGAYQTYQTITNPTAENIVGEAILGASAITPFAVSKIVNYFKTPAPIDITSVSSSDILFKAQQGETNVLGGEITSQARVLGSGVTSELTGAFKTVNVVEPKTIVTSSGALETAAKTILRGELDVSQPITSGFLKGFTRVTTYNLEELATSSGQYQLGQDVISLSKSASGTGKELILGKGVTDVLVDIKIPESMVKLAETEAGFKAQWQPVQRTLVSTVNIGETNARIPVFMRDIGKITDLFPSQPQTPKEFPTYSTGLEPALALAPPKVDILKVLQQSYIEAAQNVQAAGITRNIGGNLPKTEATPLSNMAYTVGKVIGREVKGAATNEEFNIATNVLGSAGKSNEGSIFSQTNFESLGSFLGGKAGQDIWSSIGSKLGSSSKSRSSEVQGLSNVVNEGLSQGKGMGLGLGLGVSQGLGQGLGLGQQLGQLLGQQQQTGQQTTQTQGQPPFSSTPSITAPTFTFPSFSSIGAATRRRRAVRGRVVSQRFIYTPTIVGELSGRTIRRVPSSMNVQSVGIRYPVSQAPRRIARQPQVAEPQTLMGKIFLNNPFQRSNKPSRLKAGMRGADSFMRNTGMNKPIRIGFNINKRRRR